MRLKRPERATADSMRIEAPSGYVSSLLLSAFSLALITQASREAGAQPLKRQHCVSSKNIRDLLISTELRNVVVSSEKHDSNADQALLLNVLRSEDSIDVIFSKKLHLTYADCASVIWLRETSLRLIVVTHGDNKDRMMVSYGPLHQAMPIFDDVSNEQEIYSIEPFDFDGDKRPELIEQTKIHRKGYRWNEYTVYRMSNEEIKPILTLYSKWDNVGAVSDLKNRIQYAAHIEIKKATGVGFAIQVNGKYLRYTSKDVWRPSSLICGKTVFSMFNGEFHQADQ